MLSSKIAFYDSRSISYPRNVSLFLRTVTESLWLSSACQVMCQLASIFYSLLDRHAPILEESGLVELSRYWYVSLSTWVGMCTYPTKKQNWTWRIKCPEAPVPCVTLWYLIVCVVSELPANMCFREIKKNSTVGSSRHVDIFEVL